MVNTRNYWLRLLSRNDKKKWRSWEEWDTTKLILGHGSGEFSASTLDMHTVVHTSVVLLVFW